MSTKIGVTLTLTFAMLCVITSSILMTRFGNIVSTQLILILIIAAIGEHHVSGKGYYHYTKKNGLFIGRVPLWIPLMWAVAIQGSFALLLVLRFNTTEAVALSGVICTSLDFYFIEPLLSRKIGMWLWNSVENGYFRFIPTRINRFTAPFGNYVTWMIFPVILNAFLNYSFLILTQI